MVASGSGTCPAARDLPRRGLDRLLVRFGVYGTARPEGGPLPDGSYRQSGLMLMNADGADKRMIVIAPSLWVYGWAFVVSQREVADHWRAGAGRMLWSEIRCTEQVFAYRTDGSDLFSYLDPSRKVNYLVPSRQVTHGQGRRHSAVLRQ